MDPNIEGELTICDSCSGTPVQLGKAYDVQEGKMLQNPYLAHVGTAYIYLCGKSALVNLLLLHHNLSDLYTTRTQIH